jgi:glycosyltransferase involved in cell wall biosynthesis
VNPLYAVAPCDATPVAREKNLFLFVGQLVRSKGIDTLLKAMALLEQPATLAIVGRGRQEVMFEELATKLGVERKVRFVGHVSQTELSDWYRRAACLVLPVRQPESFALVGPEAMSHGTPAVATNIGGVGTWLVDGETGLTVPPNDAGALARAMDRVVTSNGLCATMGKNALKRYNELFRPEMHLDVLVQIFSDLHKARAPE